MQDSVICEAWCRWEDSLRTACRMLRVAAAALQDRPRGEPLETCDQLMPKEGENLKKWKEQFLDEGDSFEEYLIEVNTFGMDDWSD